MMTNSTVLNFQDYPVFRPQLPLPISRQKLTIFCDFDGAIVDISNRYYSTYKLALARTKSSYQAQGIVLSLKKLSKQEFWKLKQDRIGDFEIARRSGLHGEQIKFFLKQIHQTVNHPIFLQKDRIQPGVNWALEMLHLEGVKLVLVTLRSQSQVEHIVEKYALKDLFSGIYGLENSQIACSKNTELKTKLLRKAIDDNPYTSAYMIGDTEADILAAKALGIPAIALTCGIRSYWYLLQFQPHGLYTNLLSIARYLLKQRL
ncbi:MAG: HAD family hydrolase [Prochloraceae cyanobacterium]